MLKGKQSVYPGADERPAPHSTSLTAEESLPAQGPSAANPYVRVNDAFLIKEFKLTPNFIAKHAREMGNFTKPRSYFLADVIRHLEKIRDRSLIERGYRSAEQKEAAKRKVVELFEQVQRKHSSRNREVAR